MSRAEGGLGVRGVRGESWGGEQLELQGLGRSAGLGELAAWSLRERQRKKKREISGKCGQQAEFLCCCLSQGGPAGPNPKFLSEGTIPSRNCAAVCRKSTGLLQGTFPILQPLPVHLGLPR